MNLLKRSAVEVHFTLLFAITTLVAATITQSQYQTGVNIRLVLIAILIVAISWDAVKKLKKNRLSRLGLWHSSATIILIFYGLFLSSLHGGIEFLNASPMLYVFLLIAVANMSVLTRIFTILENNKNLRENGTPLVSAFFISVAMWLLLTGGMVFTFPPSLNFQLPDGTRIYYSQGFTQFSALGALWFAVIAGNKSGSSIGYILLAFIFFNLSLLGGARGDMLAGILALIFYILRTPTPFKLIIIFIVTTLLINLIFLSGLWEKIVIFQRLSVFLEGNYGQRDVLFSQAIDLLANDTKALLFGGGFNYFQVYNGSEYGLYPHNVVLEFVITFGILPTIVLFPLSVIGGGYMYFKFGKSPFFYLLIVSLIALMKSGSLIDFLALPTLILFASYGGRALGKFKFRSRRSVRKPAIFV